MMSVLQCDRGNCQNIMCNRFSSRLQVYICNDCFDELISLGVTTNLESFMSSNKIAGQAVFEDYAYFNSVFPLRD